MLIGCCGCCARRSAPDTALAERRGALIIAPPALLLVPGPVAITVPISLGARLRLRWLAALRRAASPGPGGPAVLGGSVGGEIGRAHV